MGSLPSCAENSDSINKEREPLILSSGLSKSKHSENEPLKPAIDDVNIPNDIQKEHEELSKSLEPIKPIENPQPVPHLEPIKDVPKLELTDPIPIIKSNCSGDPSTDFLTYESLGTIADVKNPPEEFITKDLAANFILSKFQFRMKKYEGMDNPYDTIIDDKRSYFGQVRVEKEKENGETNNILEGVGYLVTENQLMVGYFQKSQLKGPGVVVIENGVVFKGIWTDNKMNGYGVFLRGDELEYEGEWKDSMQHGKGKMVWKEGMEYHGDFKDSQMSGKGVMYWKNEGSFYKGDFSNDKIEGVGEYMWKDGKWYRGQWVDKCMEGEGVFVWPDGQRFEGKYRKNIKHGKGVLLWPDGRRLNAYWENGKPEGEGYYVSSKGETVRGFWKDGKMLNKMPNLT